MALFVLVNLMQNLRLTDGQAYRVITRSPTLIAAMAVGALQSVINYGMMAFNPSFLITIYDLPMRDAAWQFGLVAAGMGIIGPLIWGPLSDRLNLRFPGAGRAWVALFAMGISPIMSFWVYHAPDAHRFLLAVRGLQPGADRLAAAALCDPLRSGAAANARDHRERLPAGRDDHRPRASGPMSSG